MSPRKQNKTIEKDNAKASHALYVYCVGESNALARLFEEKLPAAIEPAGKLELVVESNLAAVASQVPLSDYSEDALNERLADAAWTAMRAVRHEKVVEHFSSRASVVPLRFGVIYFARERVEQMLSDKAAELHAIIERLNGRQEWGITICCNQEEFIKIIDTLSSRLRALTERAKTARPGEAYLLRKKIDALKADEARLEIKRMVAEIERALAARSEQAASLRVIKDEATEQGQIVAKLAFLVATERFNDFHEEAERLAHLYDASGFKFEMTGPWPAYNFSTGE